MIQSLTYKNDFSSYGNRVAILGETLYMSTLDAHLVAIDARSGSLVWNTEVADHRAGYSKTAAPLIVNGKVVYEKANARESRLLFWRFIQVAVPYVNGLKFVM